MNSNIAKSAIMVLAMSCCVTVAEAQAPRYTWPAYAPPSMPAHQQAAVQQQSRVAQQPYGVAQQYAATQPSPWNSYGAYTTTPQRAASTNPQYYLTTATAGQATAGQAYQPPAAQTQTSGPAANQYYGAMSAPHQSASVASHGSAGGGCQSCGAGGHGGAYAGHTGGGGCGCESGNCGFGGGPCGGAAGGYGGRGLWGGGLFGCGGYGGGGYHGNGAAGYGYGAAAYGYDGYAAAAGGCDGSGGAGYGYDGSGGAGYGYDGSGAAGYGYDGSGGAGYGYDGYGGAGYGYGGAGYGYGGGSWYAGVGGLIMTRDRADSVWLSFDDADPVGKLLGTRGAEMGWGGGYEITVGRHFCGGLWAMEATYWGLSEVNEQADAFRTQITAGASLNTALDFSALNIGIDNVDDWYNDAEHHRLRRSYKFNNLELNVLHGPLHACHPCGSRLRVKGLCGMRFFRFEDMFSYDTADVSPTFGTTPDDEVFYQIDIKNDLVGVQLGCLAEYDVTGRFRCFADGKFGMYGNRISHRSTVSNRNGVGVVGPGNPTAGALFDINSKKDDFSFLAELELGADWHFNPCWSARVGYRVVAVTGVAHTVEQIPVSFADVGGVADIDSNGHLILHGFHASVEKHW